VGWRSAVRDIPIVGGDAPWGRVGHEAVDSVPPVRAGL